MGETESSGQKWFVRFGPDADSGEFMEVSGEAVTIPGWEHLDLCVHPAVPNDGVCWTVTEGSTGCLLVTGSSRDVTIKKAAEWLAYFGRKRVDTLIADVLLRYGPSPRTEQAPEVQG